MIASGAAGHQCIARACYGSDQRVQLSLEFESGIFAWMPSCLDARLWKPGNDRRDPRDNTGNPYFVFLLSHIISLNYLGPHRRAGGVGLPQIVCD